MVRSRASCLSGSFMWFGLSGWAVTLMLFFCFLGFDGASVHTSREHRVDTPKIVKLPNIAIDTVAA